MTVSRLSFLGTAIVLLTCLACSSRPESRVVTRTPEAPPARPEPTVAISERVPTVPEPVPEPIAECLVPGVPFDASRLPKPGPGKTIVAGVTFRETTLARDGVPMTLWIYTPEPLPAKKLACVLIAPAGTPLVHGVGLTDEDRDEHLPYAKDGYAVVAYSLDGGVDTDPGMTFKEGVKAFLAADLGIANARAALDYVAAQLPEIDVTRVVVAGHSSAGTLALQLAENEPRVKAAIAYAPVVNLESWSRLDLDALDIPEVREAQMRLSPDRGISRLACPTFLFHADDDSNVLTRQIEGFAEELRKVNGRTVYETVPTGEHYSSMIDEGIPKALAWLRAQPDIHSN